MSEVLSSVPRAARSSTALCGLLLAACSSVGLTTQVGYTYTSIGGNLALDDGTGSSNGSIEQGIGSAFGLGDGRGSPYLRAQADLGGPVLTGSVFWLRETGSGELGQAFGGLTQGDIVETSLDLAVAKLDAVYDFEVGPLKIAPGVAFDVFAIDFSARDANLGGREEIDDVVFVPMPFVRLEGGLGPVTAIGELGYLDVSNLGDTGGRFLDCEARLEYRLFSALHLFAGYRFLDLDGTGTTGSEDYALDLQLRGWTIGGGVRF